ncbi:RHS repeat-associated core domain-containing protein [Streptomyces sp. NPDC057746]|uniref:RHS repeat-associated core domain-containing protein n=1 Tax=Streptomyces sp. NPDC057746 TaxID=3346237 RepID=UPI0036B3A1C8
MPIRDALRSQGHGGIQDDNTGLTNLGAREYDPTIGRFLSPDPVLNTGDPQSWNAYDYANDTPVTTSDPSGLCPADLCGIGYPIGGTGTSPSNPVRYIQDGPVDPGGSNHATCHHGKCSDGHAFGASGGNISKSTYDPQAEAKALARAKATADAAAAAAKKQASGLKHQLLSLVADIIGLTDAYNCFTKGDVMGCINTALTFVPWGKVFKAIKVGVEAFKIWRSLDRAYTAVKDAEEAARLAEDAVKAERAIADAGKAEGAGAEAAEGCLTHSFIPSTAVRLADGSSKPIGKIRVGDTVLATDPQTGVTAPEKVQNVIITQTDRDFTTLTLDTTPVRGPSQDAKAYTPSSQTLTTTWHHPFWDATLHRWTDAHDLTPGTKLLRSDGTTVTVTLVHNFHRHGITYDLTVGNLHTYYVLAGTTPVLVHNCGEYDSEAEGLTDAAYEGLRSSHGDQVADGVDYQVGRMHDGSASAADHVIPGIGHDPAALADYFRGWQGKMTHNDVVRGSRVAFDDVRNVLVVETADKIHAYRYTAEKFTSALTKNGSPRYVPR